MFWRYLEKEITNWEKKPYVQILFGARQTGKSTLLKKALSETAMWLDLSDPGERSRYLARPQDFIAECKALPKSNTPSLIVIDEAQAVPALFDAVQSLYDADKARWRFVLCGSSARKLRLTGANLLPGRAVYHHLYPLTVFERPFVETNAGIKQSVEFPRLLSADRPPKRLFPEVSLEQRLAFGELPGIAIADETDRPALLKSYALIYLEEEIRREGLVKDWGAFVRFLALAAAESGGMINCSALSRESGVSMPTIKSYYQLLEDMFIGFRIPAFSKSPRKYLLSTPKFFFFDLGVRHAAAGVTPGFEIVKTQAGIMFEQWVGQELWKRLGYLQQGKLFHFRSRGGAEIDFIVEMKGKYIPIEVKWTERPTETDARHLITFINDMGDKSSEGYIICRCARPMQIHENVMAVPYWWI
ncbi:MAG: ATP-binding protein [Desulfobacterales bacterium]|jgi:predicted AAA+ superfamily ATPase|nr:ATP-binding protein [Desulfobacterales bacterium]